MAGSPEKNNVLTTITFWGATSIDKTYDSGYLNFLSQIRNYSPNAVVILEKLYDDQEAKLAFYAAFTIACLEISIQTLGYKGGDQLRSDSHSFTFFEATDGNEAARRLFAEVLKCYQADCEARFSPHHGGVK